MIHAIRRVFSAPGLLLAVAFFQLMFASLMSGPVKAAVAAAMGQFTVAADGGLLASMLPLFIDNPGIPAAIGDLLAGSAVLALIFWTLLAAGMIHRLHAPAPASEVAAAAVRGWLPMIVVTLWQLIPRLVLLGLVGLVSSKILAVDSWGWLGLLPMLIVLGYVTCALDLARCDVVLHEARRFHVKTALAGFARALRPGVLLPSMFFNICQWACVAAVLGVSISGLGSGWAIWAARGLAILGVFFGLARIAVAVGARPVRETAPAPRPHKDAPLPTAAAHDRAARDAELDTESTSASHST